MDHKNHVRKIVFYLYESIQNWLNSEEDQKKKKVSYLNEILSKYHRRETEEFKKK